MYCHRCDQDDILSLQIHCRLIDMFFRNFRQRLNWYPPMPFYYGWFVLGLAGCATFAATGSSQVVLGGVQDFIIEDMGWSRSTLAFAATAGTWASGLITPIVGNLADRYGPRGLMPLGLLVAGIAFLLLSGIDSVVQYYVAYIIGRAISNPVLIGVVPRTVAVNFFRRRRNIVLAISSTIRPVSGAINIMLFSLVAGSYGWRTAYRYLGILCLVLVLPLLWLLRRRPEDIGLLPDGIKSAMVIDKNSERSQKVMPLDGEFSWRVGEAFKTRALWCIVSTSAIGTVASSSVGFGLKPYLLEAGVSQTQAAAVLSLGTVLALGNVLWGILADRITPRRCLIVATVVAAIMDVFLITVHTLPSAYIFAVVWGLSSGSVGSLEHMMIAQYYGRDSYGSILGSFGPMQTMALGLGPGLGAVIRDITGSYHLLYISMACLYLIGTVLIILSTPPALPKRANASES